MNNSAFRGKDGRPPPLRIRQPRGDCIARAVCLLICLLALVLLCVPIAYVLFASLHCRGTWTLEGYALLLSNPLVLSGLANSLFLAGVGTIYALLLEIPAAFILSRKRHQALASLFLALGQFGVSILPLYLLLKRMGLLNTLWAMILPCAVSVYNTNLLRARMINVSGELEDAAAIDGAGTITYIVRILLPLLGPTVGCVAFFHICGYWSSTFFAQTFISDERLYPLSLVMMELLIKNRSADVLLGSAGASSVAALQTAQYALCVLSVLPLLIIFLLLKKHIRSLDTDGSITF